jgi:hypothetical protein
MNNDDRTHILHHIQTKERFVRKLNDELAYLKPTHMYYNIRKVTHSNEVKCLKSDIECDLVEYHQMTSNIYLGDLLEDFLFISLKDPMGIHYYTVKNNYDPRLAGWSPIENPIECDTIIKWVSGEYNSNPEIVYTSDPRDPLFTYRTVYRNIIMNIDGVNTPVPHAILHRYRIKPDYVLNF